ncbi:efflux RND transporter permease subunit [Saccharophagus degradans]|uniref:efflux RND transporter permease subunit n=1 Tax=Saccharophagus degradans TaxID=86304 RepID=UPI002477EFD2|nr:efflux RND transporter permease subunit [Saccharophagus degradans]WGP00082.1 efflux RND transporter permease subunit [Saccharophagus degradans]
MENKQYQQGGSSGGLSGWFVMHPNAAKILLMVIMLAGFVGVNSLPQEVFPPFAPSRVDIDIPVRGGTASDVEELVVKKVEESLEGLAGIERIVANSTDNGARISVELVNGADQQSLLSLIKSRVDGISGLPISSEPPVFSLPEPVGPVQFINITGDVPLPALLGQAVKFKSELSRLEGISYAVIENEPELPLYIDINPDKLQQYQLSLTDVADTVARYSVNVAGGTIQTLGNRYQLRANTLGNMASDFIDIPIVSAASGVVVRLGDIAEIQLAPHDDYVAGKFNGKPSLMLSVYRDPKVPFSTASESINTLLDAKRAALSPAIELIAWQDESREFTTRISLLVKNGVGGFIIICLLMGIFVNPQIAIWTAIGIPISILGAMGLMHFAGLDLSLNAVTLLGFIIALGMIVDDALVIGESIQYETAQNGHSMHSVVTGVNRVAIPATFGVLTTIAAFFPLTLTEGDMGSKLGGVGMVVICCLIVSLVESKFVLPSHLRKPSKILQKPAFNKLNALSNGATKKMDGFVERYYKPALDWVVVRPVRTISAVVGVLVISLAMIPLGLLKMAIIPNIADFALQASFQFHPSVAPSIRETIGDKATQQLRAVSEEVKQKYNLDYQPVKHISQHYSGSELVVDVELEEAFNAPYDAYDIQQMWRDSLPYTPGISSLSIDAGSGSSEKIAIELSGENIESLRALSKELREHLASQDDVVDIRDSELANMIEYRFKPTDLAKSLNISDAEIITQVRAAFYGQEAQRITVGEREARVMVRLEDEYRHSLTGLNAMLLPIQSADGSKQYIPLSQLVEIEQNVVPSEIRRINKQRTITVYANTKMNTRSPEDVAEEMGESVLPEMVKAYPGVGFSIEGEAKEANKSLSSILSSAGLAGFILFALMALPLGSFRYPALILCLIPFGMIGAVWGHIAYGLTFSLMSIFGVIALAGVLINNGLLLVDQYRENIRLGQDITEAIKQACVRRFRPIVLTSITTLAGLMPLMWEGDPEALWLVPIAISLGVGLLVATAITLIIFPAMLLLLDRNKVHEQQEEFASGIQPKEI